MFPQKKHTDALPKETVHMAKDAVGLLEKQIAIGQSLLRTRPIGQKTYAAWESHTLDILKKSSCVDPLGRNRFICCGKPQIRQVSNEAFQENQRAMIVYDQISILEYHLNALKHELAFSKNPGALH
jgi:hypothetical protein